MADYYPLIARAVAGLEINSGENRRALYERARTALIGQLRSVAPALSESDITRERLALEEVIRRVESEAAQRARRPAAAEPPVRPRPPESARPPVATPRPGPEHGAGPGDNGGRDVRPSPRPNSQRPVPPRQDAGPAPRHPPGERPSLAEQSRRGFRDVVADAEHLGRAAAQANRSARKTYSEVPSPTPEFDRLEPSMEERGAAPNHDLPYSYDESIEEAERPRRPAQSVAEAHARARIFNPRVIRLAIGAAVVVLLGVAAVLAWPRMSAWMKGFGGPATVEAPKDAAPATQPKISDRVGQPASSQQVAPVAQRVVLYEEDPGEPQGKQYVGSVIWRTEPVTTPAGQPQDYAIRADVEIPDRKIKLTLSIRRNTDQTLPASHTVELAFVMPDGGSVGNVPGVLMKQNEQTRGTPLAGLAVKVTDGFFLIGLSNVEADRQRNIMLLKERPWFDVPIVYTNQRRAILAIEKGSPGERAFADAFMIWKQ
ncbi:MAG: hypothetical protein EPO23_05735 [Xanthobacteraceae bacterium]|nr:MAG: hypothetical protein EPO23_05735 [Xanthobacteraceae bacterium]